METNSIHIECVVNEEVVCNENEEVVDIISKTKEEVEEICEPYAGMEFDSVTAYKNYYQTYKNKKGFSQKIRSQEKNEQGEVRFFIFLCSREGTYKSRSNKTLKLRPTTKSGCKAIVRAILGPNKVQITNAIIDHNHELSSPVKSKFYKKNRIIPKNAQRRIENNDKADIQPYKSYNSFFTEAGGHDNVSFTQKDVHNHLDKLRWLRLGDGDAMALKCYFQKIQANNANFFYDIDLDDEGRLKNVFWADAWSRAAYKEFGGVITFDTTYLTNKYDMPFAPFVGVNHHGQSIFFCCGLISSETIETFVWLFKSWLVCMNESAPTSIITDQDKAMLKTIEIVFPNTHHRWCIWHIMKKLPEKLSGYINMRISNMPYKEQFMIL